MEPPLVYLIDDNEAFRRSTAWLLEGAGFEVLDFAGGEAFLQAHGTALRPSRACVVSDIRMPGMSGLELQQELKRRQLAIPVVFITGHGDVPLAVEAMRNGAANFIEKPFAPDTLAHAVHECTRVSRRSQNDGEPSAQSRLAVLTPRERQVFDLVIEGRLNKTIADRLGISIKTVEMHRANMMSKLAVRNLPELVRLAVAAQSSPPAAP